MQSVGVLPLIPPLLNQCINLGGLERVPKEWGATEKKFYSLNILTEKLKEVPPSDCDFLPMMLTSFAHLVEDTVLRQQK